jgi:TM2 domain-containing membrane protein YozV
MQKRSSFLTFLTALVPGVGYMYLGLVRRGLQVLIAFLLIEPVFRLLGIGFLGDILRIPIWFYTFFDTFSVARMIDMGETVHDSDFIFNKYVNEGSYPTVDRNKLSKNLSLIIALVLILLGTFAILNNVFQGYAVYQLIRSYISKLLIPVLLVLAGIYMLFKNRKQ